MTLPKANPAGGRRYYQAAGRRRPGVALARIVDDRSQWHSSAILGRSWARDFARPNRKRKSLWWLDSRRRL